MPFSDKTHIYFLYIQYDTFHLSCITIYINPHNYHVITKTPSHGYEKVTYFHGYNNKNHSMIITNISMVITEKT